MICQKIESIIRSLLANSEHIKNLIEAVAIVVGGGWALWIFRIKRQRATALSIELTTKCFHTGPNQFNVWLDVAFKNCGAVRLAIRNRRSPAYIDSYETLKYGASAIIRAVPDALVSGTFDWYSSCPIPLIGDIELNLLYESEVEPKYEFWMEPGETTPCGVLVALKSGPHAIMITFLGEEEDDFWRRIFYVNVHSSP